jgi:TfoX/Sxy family transcriptional regulator of competence genes
VGIYRDGEMGAIVYDGRAYIKVPTEADRARFVASGMSPFRPGRQRTFNSFLEVPPEVLDDARTLRAWTEHAD